MAEACPPMPLWHITPQTESAASAGAGNAGEKSLGKEHEEQGERRDYSVVCCLLCIRAMPRWWWGVYQNTQPPVSTPA